MPGSAAKNSNLPIKEGPKARSDLGNLLKNGFINGPESSFLIEDKKIKVLADLKYRSLKNVSENITKYKHTKLYNILASPEILTLAYSNIFRNKGSLTPGSIKTDTSQKKCFTLKGPLMKRLLSSLREGTYKPGPLILMKRRRIYIPKPGKKFKARLFFEAPNFSDKIVQEAIRLILDSIYDPLFEKLDDARRDARRGNYCTQDAIHKLEKQSQGKNIMFAIEGDIKGAYDNVQHQTLLNILSKQIKDKKFLNLIKLTLEAGILDKQLNTTSSKSRSIIGVPQGGILSPLYFNIYMHYFDCFVHECLESYTDKLNLQQNFCYCFRGAKRFEVALRPHYNKYYIGSSTELKLRNQNKQLSNSHQKGSRASQANKKAQAKFISIIYKSVDQKSEFNKLSTLINGPTGIQNKYLLSLVPIDRKRVPIKIVYVRYADDWVILTNGTLEYCEQIKQQCSSFLKHNLSLTLSEDKTKITQIISQPSKFLGFEIKGPRICRVAAGPEGVANIISGATQKHITKAIKNNKIQLRCNRSGSSLRILPDWDRIINRLHLRRYCDSAGFPRENPGLSLLNDYEIINKYNSVLRGLTNYYYAFVSVPSRLGRIRYILEFSLAKTLAQKHKISVKKVFNTYGKPLTASLVIDTKTNTISFPTLVQWAKQASQTAKQILSLRKYKLNYLDLIDVRRI
jgi:RNA-directed DNA polymerase